MDLVLAQLQAARAGLEAATIAVETALSALQIDEMASESEDDILTPPKDSDAVCAHTEALEAPVMGHPGRRYCPACETTIGES